MIWKDNPNILERIKINSQRVYFETSLAYLGDHLGLRPKKLHTFIGTPGGGKSTLTRTMILDCAVRKYKTGIYLSEETEDDFLVEVAHMYRTLQTRVKYLFPFSEMGHEDPSWKVMGKKVSDWIEENKIQVLFWDNITTMANYQRLDDQEKWVKVLRRLAEKHDIPVVVLVHTGKQIKEGSPGLTDMNDVRGNAALVNQSQFVYALQPVFVGDQRFTFLRTLKARGSKVSHAIYQLSYDHDRRIFSMCERKSFKQFKEIFGERNKL